MIAAVREGRGRTVLRTLRGTEPWRPCVVHGSPGPARVALVQTRASLIAGDDVSLSVSVGAGAALEIVELGATLAHDGRGGPMAQVRATIEVAEGGLLMWEGKPLIAGAGCRVLRVTEARVAMGGRLMIGESVVLGRAGQAPGEATSRVSIWHGRAPTVMETLRTGDRAVLGSPVVAGSSRMITGLTLVGLRDPEPPPKVMQAHGLASVWREATDPVSGAASAAALSRRWRRLLEGAAIESTHPAVPGGQAKNAARVARPETNGAEL